MAANIVAAAAAAQEVDPMLKKAIKLLHSTNPTSASELRLLLDEALKLRFGPEKMISKNMSQRMMDDEANFPGRATPQPPAQAMATDEIINLTNSPDKVPSDSPDTIADSDDGSAGGLAMSGVVNTGDTGDFGDLNCCVCGEMVFTATNRLIECSKCGALYHQECHKPPISNEEASDDQEHIWQCDNCCNKPSTSRSAGTTAIVAPTPTLTPTPTPTVIIPDEPMPVVSKPKSSVPSSRSSTSSNSSSPFYKPEVSSSTNASSSSGSKHGHKSSSSSSSKSHKEDRSSKSVAHSLSTISAPEKHTSGSSSSGTSSSRRGSSNTKSSSSKSKHHESSSSSSSKRRSK